MYCCYNEIFEVIRHAEKQTKCFAAQKCRVREWIKKYIYYHRKKIKPRKRCEDQARDLHVCTVHQ